MVRQVLVSLVCYAAIGGALAIAADAIPGKGAREHALPLSLIHI